MYEIDENVRLPTCGTNGGLKKAANSSQATVKEQVYIAYSRFRFETGKKNGSNGSYFAAHMCFGFSEEIPSTETVMRWMRHWREKA